MLLILSVVYFFLISSSNRRPYPQILSHHIANIYVILYNRFGRRPFPVNPLKAKDDKNLEFFRRLQVSQVSKNPISAGVLYV